MAPSLAYGRHRGPAYRDSRIAAVAIMIYQDDEGDWVTLLTRRPDQLQHHGGQICLPGGRVESGETVREAALREFEEELGVRPVVITDCGQLSAQYVYGSDNLIHPLVFQIQTPGRLRPDPTEVAEVIQVPISVISDESNHQVMSKRKEVGSDPDCQLTFRAPVIQHGQHRIWGATALILDELAQILHL